MKLIATNKKGRLPLSALQDMNIESLRVLKFVKGLDLQLLFLHDYEEKFVFIKTQVY